jgi:hypothetical protein
LKFTLETKPARDGRNPDPQENTGVRGVVLLLGCEDVLGRTTKFELWTNWHHDEVQKTLLNIGNTKMLVPYPAGLHFRPTEDVKITEEDREQLTRALWERLVSEGEDAFFRCLEEIHDHMFSTKE